MLFEIRDQYFLKKLTEVRNIGNDNKLVLVVDGISYDIAGENTENAYLGLRVFFKKKTNHYQKKYLMAIFGTI